MFIGAIPADLRAILAEMAPAWRDRPIYVGASGNFTMLSREDVSGSAPWQALELWAADYLAGEGRKA